MNFAHSVSFLTRAEITAFFSISPSVSVPEFSGSTLNPTTTYSSLLIGLLSSGFSVGIFGSSLSPGFLGSSGSNGMTLSEVYLSLYCAVKVVSSTFPDFSVNFLLPSAALLSNHASNTSLSSVGVGVFGSATAGVAFLACSQVKSFLTS